MSVIHMETERVRAVANAIRTTAGQMSEQNDTLNANLRLLQDAWEGGNAADFYHDMRQLTRQLDQHVQALGVLAGYLDNKVTEWETADERFGLTARERIGRIGRQLEEKDALVEGVFRIIFGALATSKVGWRRKGELVFKGKNMYRDAAGLPAHLRNVKVANFAKSFSRSKFGKFDAAFLIMDFIGKAAQNFADYKNPGEFMSVIAYDGAFVGLKWTLVSAAQSAVMTTVGATALTTLATAGAPAFMVVGSGVLMWWGTGLLTDYVLENGFELLQKQGTKKEFVRASTKLIQGTWRKAVQKVDSAFGYTVKTIIGGTPLKSLVAP